MLELKNIMKDYPAGDGIVHALKGINLRFRESDFVSVLGPSGCGKTTMLNIVGGLDQYTDGDLIIDGKSTKDFNDRDWDTYRNHSIGFVFQSYNLIPHQTVLQNVELALTLSGVSKAERRQRAKDALEKVGLATQLNKRPGEMSGGQMQRVAIARALVNDPEIILADEPTGALDTETSVQVMDILKEISKDHLIIMVTHNPELAEKYSTRIIRMLDGEITDDSLPLTDEELLQNEDVEKPEEQPKVKGKKKKPSMSFFTSFSLSLKNLFTKKGRTALTAFAGSIGIIGIALIYAVSQGTTAFIDAVQEDTLASYPLTLEQKHIDLGTLLQTFVGASKNSHDHDKNAVYQKSVVYDMINALNNLTAETNDLKAFKSYIEGRLASGSEDDAKLREAVNGIQYTYNMDLLVYTKNIEGNIVHSDTNDLLKNLISEYMGSSMDEMDEQQSTSSNPLTSMMSGGGTNARNNLWQEILSGKDGSLINPILTKQYDVVYGAWPTAYNEIVLVLDENNELDDMTLYALGLKSEEEIDKIMDAAMKKGTIEHSDKSWSYEEICKMEFRTFLNCDCYTLDSATGLYNDLRKTDAGLEYLYKNGIPLKVSGIIRPNKDAVSTMLKGSIGYTNELTKFVVNKSKNSDVVKAQQKTPSTDILTGLPFDETNGSLTVAEKSAQFKKYIDSLDNTKKAQAYTKIMSIPSDDELKKMVAQAKGNATREAIQPTLISGLSQQMNMDKDEVEKYLTSLSDEEFDKMYSKILTEQVKAQYSQQVKEKMASISTEQAVAALDMAMKDFTDEQCAKFYDEVPEFSDSTFDKNMRLFANVDLDNPASINLYSSTFANKEVIEDCISKYNEGVEELKKITYTDYVGIMMSSITTVIDAVTYVLIAFVAISLIVSSIMIGVITLISVQERTKEIGILRALGASKRDVSSLFNAETVIIGFISGLIGVGITYLLTIPINLIIHYLTDINNLSAYLPIPAALIFIGISIILTLIAGIIPSRSAAKKDPVVALRSE